MTSDIDECSADSSLCDENAYCTNTDGSYSCTCKQEFDGDGISCKGNLKREHSWTLSVRNCKTSFSNLNIHVVNDFTDFDKCSLEPSPCDEKSDCGNSEGSYSCTCKTGFTGNGAICEGVRYQKTIHFASILSHKMRRCYFFSVASRIADGFFHRSWMIKIQALLIWKCAMYLMLCDSGILPLQWVNLLTKKQGFHE